MRILVVDDDEVDAEYIRRTLRNSSQGVDIEVASTVDDALSVCTLKNFDVILLDYRLPGRDGIELVFELKAKPQIPDSAIVMMSTSENDELAKTCIQAGAQDFILKSEITPSKLRRCIINSQTRYELEQQLKESHERIRLLAEKDPLTELANRRYFEDKLKQTVNQCIRKNSQFALLILDLDNFKYANDSFGHDNGDVLLKKVTTRIRSTLRGFELFARLGGDEFAILIPEVDRLNVPSMIANRILHVLEKPFELGGLSISTSASIGVVLFPQDGSTSEELLKNADIAMYRSKKKGKGQFCYFEQEMHYQILERVNIEKEILYGLRNNEFVLKFQPIISSRDKTVYAFEALIRWYKSGAMRDPDRFIPVAEESGSIVPLGRWIIDEACKAVSTFNELSDHDIKIAINLSAIQLADIGLINHIKTRIEFYGLKPHWLEFELTETSLLNTTAENIKIISEIRQLGCSISLDDFGTGYSSISHLQNFPINTVKIDRSILPSFDGDASERRGSLFNGLVFMIKSLQLEVISEGIENVYQAQLCQEIAVDFLQGYFFNQPLDFKHAVLCLQRTYHIEDDRKSVG